MRRITVFILATLIALCLAQAEPKPGTCAAMSTLKRAAESACVPMPICNKDSDCYGTQKCCPGGCLGNSCQEVLETNQWKIKSGTCPAPAHIPVELCPNFVRGPNNLPALRVTENILCIKDFQCPGNQKCCDATCGGRSCQDALQDKAVGSCPAIPDAGDQCKLRDPYSQVPRLCTRDNHCRGDLKCCFNGCYPQCMNFTGAWDYDPAPTRCNLCTNGMNQCAHDESCCGCGSTGICQKSACLLRCPIGPCQVTQASRANSDSDFIGGGDLATQDPTPTTTTTTANSSEFPSWAIALCVVLLVLLVLVIVIAVLLGRKINE